VTSIFQDLFYTYDPTGNITHIRDDAQQTIYFNGQVVLPQCDYVYDPIYRLISATGREHIGQLAQPQTSWNDEFRVNLPQAGDGTAMRNYTEQYLYNAVGNFEKLIHQAAQGNWTRAYTYNEASLLDSSKNSNRLSNAAVGAVTEPYTHDAHGNMTSMPHLTLMQWDFKDQLNATSRQAVNATPPKDKMPETTLYVYDAGGQRARKVTERQDGSRKAERIYLGGFEIYRGFNANGKDFALERETLHITDGKQRVSLVETRTQGTDGSPAQLVRYQFGSHLGSTSLELDDKANVISYEEYFPYGSTSYLAVDQGIKAAAKRYRHTGKERDEETGFTYHGARYYAAWLGRWTSCDPAGLSQSPNPYEFVGSRPLVLVDKSGLSNTHWFDFSILDELAEAVDTNLNAAARNKASQETKQDVNIPLAVVKEAAASGYELATTAPVKVAVKAAKTWQNEFVAAVVTPNANEATAHSVKAVGAAARFAAASILAYEAAKKKAPPSAQMAPDPQAPPDSNSPPTPAGPPETPAEPAQPAATPPGPPTPTPDAPPAAPASEPPDSDPALNDPPVRGERFKQGQGLNQAEGSEAGKRALIEERRKLAEGQASEAFTNERKQFTAEPDSTVSDEWGDQPLPDQQGMRGNRKSGDRWDK
jgi:RHS repeat-associated protein